MPNMRADKNPMPHQDPQVRAGNFSEVALGYTREELERPLIGVVCSYNEIVPGHMNLDKIAEAVKAGVRAAGGTPVEFPAIAVCDGIACLLYTSPSPRD